MKEVASSRRKKVFDNADACKGEEGKRRDRREM